MGSFTLIEQTVERIAEEGKHVNITNKPDHLVKAFNSLVTVGAVVFPALHIFGTACETQRTSLLTKVSFIAGLTQSILQLQLACCRLELLAKYIIADLLGF